MNATAVVLYEFAQETSKRKTRLRLNEWWEERTRTTQLTPIHDLDSATVSLVLDVRNNSQALLKQIYKANNKDQKAQLATLSMEMVGVKKAVEPSSSCQLMGKFEVRARSTCLG